MPTAADPFDLDFTQVQPLPEITLAQTQRLTATVEVGTSELKTTGFFITIESRNGDVAKTTDTDH